jgi:HJR/Mrr/RecB family endonuclease
MAILQQDYKENNERNFLAIKDNPELVTALENFFSKIPISIFTLNSRLIFFEYLLSKDFPPGQYVLWSQNDDLLKASELYSHGIDLDAKYILKPAIFEDVNSFISGDFTKMKRFLKNLVVYENDYDYTFTLLKLLHIGSASYYSQVFTTIYPINFGDIETTSFDECLFIYYKEFNKIEENIRVFNNHMYSREFDKIKENAKVSDNYILSLFTYYMIDHEKFGDIDNLDYFNVFNRQNELLAKLQNNKEEFEYRIFETNMKAKTYKANAGYTIYDVDLMGGADFEQFVSKIFTKMGYATQVTKHSGDFGVDVIAEKDGIKIGIQAKCYTGSVSNSAVQEIVAGVRHYDCHKGLVVTNSIFTKAATELAKSNNVQLWDRKVLEEKLSELFREG